MNNILYKLSNPITLTSITQFKRDNPGIGIGPGSDLREFGYAWGTMLPRPGFDYELAEPVLKGAFVEQGWNPSESNSVAEQLNRTKITEELNKRLKQPISFHEKEFQADQNSISRIDSVAAVALQALLSGVDQNSYRWYDTDKDFEWIASDNSRVRMTAGEFLEFSRAIAVRNSNLVLAARALKDLPELPDDYHDDSYWT